MGWGAGRMPALHSRDGFFVYEYLYHFHRVVGYIVTPPMPNITKRILKPIVPKAGKRHSLFIVAYNHFPGGLFAAVVGIAFWGSPFLYNFFQKNGLDSLASLILTIVVIVGIPLLLVCLFMLFRAVKIRNKLEAEAKIESDIISNDLKDLLNKEREEKQEVIRLEQVILDDIEVQKAKEKKETERWDLLDEQLRLQNVKVELASEERLFVAQQVKEIKDEREVARQESVSDDLKARLAKEKSDEERWDALHERLRIQEERNDEQDRQQVLRDEESLRMRNEDALKDQYKVLFARYLKNSPDEKLSHEVSDGLAPIPDAWLAEQPEIVKNPQLMELLKPLNLK